jgi:hypothetical protein
MSNEAYILQETKQFVFSQISKNDTAAKEHIVRVVALAQASDFVGGDLYRGIYNHSAACKFYKNVTKKSALRLYVLPVQAPTVCPVPSAVPAED